MRFLLLLLLSCSLHAAPKLIAHRGASAAAPENTLAAFELAWKEGADGIEGDFHISLDGKIVCIHDPDTKRTSGKKLIVAKTPWERLQQLDVGSWKNPRFTNERIPLLEEVLKALPKDKYFFIEIKCGLEIVGPLKQALTQADPERVILISFNPNVVHACRIAIPHFQAHLLDKLEDIHKGGGKVVLRHKLNHIQATGLQFKHTARVEKSFVDELRNAKRMTACWTVDDPKTAARVASLGVDFITTNRPAALRQVFK